MSPRADHYRDTAVYDPVRCVARGCDRVAVARLVAVRSWGRPSSRHGRRGCIVWVVGVTADSQGGGQRHRLSAAREGKGQGVGSRAGCLKMQLLWTLVEVLGNDLD